MVLFPLKFNSTVISSSLFRESPLLFPLHIHTSFFSLLPFHQHHEDHDRTHRRLGRLRHRSPCLPIGTTTLSHLPALTLFSCVFLCLSFSRVSSEHTTAHHTTPSSKHQRIPLSFVLVCALKSTIARFMQIPTQIHSNPFNTLLLTILKIHHTGPGCCRSEDYECCHEWTNGALCCVCCLRDSSPPLLFDLFDLTLLYFLVCRLLPLM